MSEEEKRLHRCCFTGHRPEKLQAAEDEVKQWLEQQIDAAIAEGFTTFISGCAMGVDIWAGQIVLHKKAENSELHLIAATPWPILPAVRAPASRPAQSHCPLVERRPLSEATTDTGTPEPWSAEND